ncbi:MAG TPA: bifunctional riboflavin kinase/FAD synthetase [Flavipsychrobacter sp.]|jgi:riboflavin kinase/FMN adenylyltransferase|nr:bifunctional riboflavin kinase/FAD synthetase [Flavipsychrobacter sp.]
MAVFYNIEHLPDFNSPVLTIGTFDGVHYGHKTILQEVVAQANEVNGESIVVTFEPHPRKLLFPNQPLRLITPLEDKLKLIEATGIQHIVVAPFTKEFSQLSAKEYISQFLVERFHPKIIIIGYDHRFGHDRTGDINLLKDLQDEFHYKVIEIPPQLIDEATVSSTKIRNALNDGKVNDAALMLGRTYKLKGEVIEGKKIGRTIGYPTANLQPADFDQLIPANGIYAVTVKWNDESFAGMLSIGFNPTVTDEKKRHIEVNIFDFQAMIYGDTLEISFVKWLRAEEKFASLEELKQQLALDKENALAAIA